MSMPTPLVLRLPRAHVRAEASIPSLLSRSEKASGAKLRALVARFALCPDEDKFVRSLLSARKNFWLFRSHQAGFCGDFVVVDMSPPTPSKRSVWVCDLKRGAPLKRGGGGAGNQLVHAAKAVDAVAHQTAALEAGTAFEAMVGDRAQLLAHFGVVHA